MSQYQLRSSTPDDTTTSIRPPPISCVNMPVCPLTPADDAYAIHSPPSSFPHSPLSPRIVCGVCVWCLSRTKLQVADFSDATLAVGWMHINISTTLTGTKRRRGRIYTFLLLPFISLPWFLENHASTTPCSPFLLMNAGEFKIEGIFSFGETYVTIFLIAIRSLAVRCLKGSLPLCSRFLEIPPTNYGMDWIFNIFHQ